MTRYKQASHAVLRIAPLALAMTMVMACDMIPGFGTPGPEIVEEANQALKDGDWTGAAEQYATLSADHADSVHVAIGQAYIQLLSGDTSAADATLAAVEEIAGEQVGEIKLRRALVALEADDFDAVKLHGAASGLPEGRLLAAEVHLVDLDSDDAASVLRDLVGAGGAVGQTASTYLEMLDDQILGGLAETTALWALGDRNGAVESAEELVKALPDDNDSKAEQTLLWAGRAATSGQPSVANSLLDDLSFPPSGQAWRVQATRAIIAAAEGDGEEAIRIFEVLAEGGAPADGLADARATACALVNDKSIARRLVEDLESSAAARCLSEAGAVKLAPTQAPAGPLKTYLENP